MGTSAPCPYCGATAGAPGERRSDPMRQAVDALYQEVARIRMLAETSADQSEEIRMLQETVARLRGRSVAAAQYGHQHHGQHGNGHHAARAAHHPAATSSLAPGSPTSSAA